MITNHNFIMPMLYWYVNTFSMFFQKKWGGITHPKREIIMDGQAIKGRRVPTAMGTRSPSQGQNIRTDCLQHGFNFANQFLDFGMDVENVEQGSLAFCLVD
jgi:hypothetical protein